MKKSIRKIISFLSIIILLSVFMMQNYIIIASDTPTKYVYTENAVNIRDKADVDSNILDNVDWKHYEYLGEEPKGKGCNNVWYKIKFTSTKTGYVCSTFAKIVDNKLATTYDRPWTTPKKSIVGGAKFIGTGYISKGQHTSYLKKFNVNPNSAYSLFTHQYMANLEAPTSEARTTYNSLKENSMLTYDYHFIIPVYNDMPEDTYDAQIRNTYDIDSRDKYKSPENTADEEFETQIATFPDSYKPYLRFLHSIYPSWTFEPLMTELDFNYSVIMQKAVGSIQGSYRYEKYINAADCAFNFEPSGYCRTEKGWYVANDKTVAFFLDPRNFLSEKYIFMFENLGYSDIYTEPSVQSVLNNTFMSGMSVIDNQSYASIFVEAGKIASVSPLYLASLARQESGVNLSSTTNGKQFEYKGIIYSELYNFFNIGAYSSEENPALAGLVYANGGAGINLADENIPTPVNNNYISMLQVNQVGTYIRGYDIGTTIANIKTKVGNQASVVVKDSNGKIKTDANKIGTGDKIQISNSSGRSEYTYVMYGDLNGDGEINSADLLRIRQHLLGTIKLTNAYLASSELTGDGSVNSADLLKIRQYLLGTSIIKQKETL